MIKIGICARDPMANREFTWKTNKFDVSFISFEFRICVHAIWGPSTRFVVVRKRVSRGVQRTRFERHEHVCWWALYTDFILVNCVHSRIFFTVALQEEKLLEYFTGTQYTHSLEELPTLNGMQKCHVPCTPHIM